jgi:serine/threonine-protein kinase RsbW
MTGNGKDPTEERLTLQSRISELSQVPAWIERLGARHSIPGNIQFAMNLCLEEVLSNIIRHGYSGKPDHRILINFTRPRDGYFVYDVEDEAPQFNPLDAPEQPALNSLDDPREGGQGIRLLRRFADRLEYQATPTGNRLSIGFSLANSAITRED